MRFFPVAACLCALSCATMHAAILPILHLDNKTLQAFDDYVARFEKDSVAPYVASGKMWMDGMSCCMRGGKFPTNRPVLESRENADFENGSIHHFTGALHVPGGTIDDMRHIMEDYPNYPRYFKPDVTRGSGTAESDSTPTDEHYLAHLTLSETTLWVSVQYDCIYDTHYKRVDPNHWESKSTSASVKELRDAKDPNQGYYPEGDDHGFVWRTTTYWFVRQNDGGLDLELDSLTLSRPNPPGFGWYGGKRSHDAVDKMLRDTKAAIEALHR
jgi:hypothetical protein